MESRAREVILLLHMPSSNCHHSCIRSQDMLTVVFHTVSRRIWVLGRSWLCSVSSWLTAHPRDASRECVLE